MKFYWLISWLKKETPCRLEYKERRGQCFLNTSNQSTQQIISIINCVKKLICTHKRYSLLLQEQYIQYIGRLLDIYYFDARIYALNQQICNTHNIHFLHKCIMKGFYRRLLSILFYQKKKLTFNNDTHIIIDLCAYSEGNWYVEPDKKMIIGKFGDYYAKCFKKLINRNKNTLPLFFNKVFYFAPQDSHNCFVYYTRISPLINVLPKVFWLKCNQYNLEVKTTTQYHLTNSLDEKDLVDQYDTFHVLSVQQLKNV